MTRIALVGCASQKLKRPAPARRLYVSPLFTKTSAYAEANSDLWFILSAKHGLVHPDEILEPYDVKLGDKRTGPPIWEWAARTAKQLNAVLEDVTDPHLVVLAGEQYRTVLHSVDAPVELPLRGLGIGQQLSWLKRELERRAPVAA